MNCFEWQNRSSDYLDGALIGTGKREADEHLDGCRECTERLQHYRVILAQIAERPRSTLPVPIRKSPLHGSIPKFEFSGRKSRWEQTPWYVRTGIEGVAVTSMVLFVIAMVPHLRTLYEHSVERRLEALNLGEIATTQGTSGSATDTAPLARGKVDSANGGSDTPTGNAEDDFNSEGESGSDNSADAEGDDESGGTGKAVKVGTSEVWRFNITHDSPRDVRTQVLAILKEANVPASTPGFGGTEAPGGIQFDLLLPRGTINGLKQRLQKLAASYAGSQPNPDNPNPKIGKFTWYKNKSRKPIPSGKARTVIWISQY